MILIGGQGQVEEACGRGRPMLHTEYKGISRVNRWKNCWQFFPHKARVNVLHDYKKTGPAKILKLPSFVKIKHF